MYRHLYISDLDGTLLRNDISISSWARTQICDLLESGVCFTLATARSVFSAREILGDLPLCLPMVGGNGAYISDFLAGFHHQVQTLPPSVSEEVLAFLLQRGIHPFLTTHTEGGDHLYYQQVDNALAQSYLDERIAAQDPRLRHTADLFLGVQEPVISFTLVGSDAYVLQLKEQLEDRFPGHLEVNYYENHYTPGWYWLNIHDRHATKGKGILEVALQAGFSAEEVTVFGDNLNDISMFHWAGRAVAVSNARHELKQIATHIIGTNEADSVVKFILDDLEKRG